jgi:hypothetical protein
MIVIGGMPRSGTNLVRRIVGSHSAIAIPPAEFNFLVRVSGGVPLKSIFSNKRLSTWGVRFDDLVDLSPRDAYVQALARYAEGQGKPFTGEKTPLNEFHVDMLDSWFPGRALKFVQMVRNPIDVAASRKKQLVKQGGPALTGGRFHELASHWRRSVTIGLARQFTMPDRHMLMRYEDLTARPAETTSGLCQFLEVVFEPERMLSLSDFEPNSDNSSFSSEIRGQKMAGRVYQPGSRADHLSEEDKAKLGGVCGELAWAMGYCDPALAIASGSRRTRFSSLRSWSRRLRQFVGRPDSTD